MHRRWSVACAPWLGSCGYHQSAVVHSQRGPRTEEVQQKKSAATGRGPPGKTGAESSRASDSPEELGAKKPPSPAGSRASRSDRLPVPRRAARMAHVRERLHFVQIVAVAQALSTLRRPTRQMMAGMLPTGVLSFAPEISFTKRNILLPTASALEMKKGPA